MRAGLFAEALTFSEPPQHVDYQWIENSQPIAAKHYLQVTDDHFSKALRNLVQLTAKTLQSPPIWPA